MTHLVVGGTGLVGSALVGELKSRERPFEFTSRRKTKGGIAYDLAVDTPRSIPMIYDVVYLVAAMPGFAICESNPLTWTVNVDAQIAIARAFSRKSNPAFIVYVSSDAVEIAGGTAYARQKATVEAFMHTIDAAIVRPSRVEASRAPDLAGFLVMVADERRGGVYRWPSKRS